MTTEKEGSWKDIFEKESRGLFEEHYRKRDKETGMNIKNIKKTRKKIKIIRKRIGRILFIKNTRK